MVLKLGPLFLSLLPCFFNFYLSLNLAFLERNFLFFFKVMAFGVAFGFLPVCILWFWTKFHQRALCPTWESFVSVVACSVVIRTALSTMLISLCFQNCYSAPGHGEVVSVVIPQEIFLGRSYSQIT